MVNIIQKHWSVLFRAALYFTIASMSPIIEKIIPVLLGDKWPSRPVWVGVGILSVSAGLIALRAFYDGSAERRGQEIKAEEKKNGNGHIPRKLNVDAELTASDETAKVGVVESPITQTEITP